MTHLRDLVRSIPLITLLLATTVVGIVGCQKPVAEEVAEEAGEATYYTCSMHPQVRQDEPGTCPICHMDLVAKTTGAKPVATPAAPESKDSAASAQRPVVDLDPGMVQRLGVRTATVERRDLTREIRATGTFVLDHSRVVAVPVRVDGFVEHVHVHDLGERVGRGEVLVEIYAPELVATQEELISALAYRAQLVEASPSTQARADALVAAARTRLARWDISSDQIDRIAATREVQRTLAIRSPISGSVLARAEALDGAAVTRGTTLYEIADLTTLWLEIAVTEADLAAARIGAQATIELGSQPGEVLQGTVRTVAPVLDADTRTLPVRIEVANPDRALRPGMWATARLAGSEALGVVAVPTTAVLETGDHPVVVVALGEGRFEPRTVELGLASDGWTEVRAGLAEGETVVVTAQFLIEVESNLRAAVDAVGGGDSGSGIRDPAEQSHVH